MKCGKLRDIITIKTEKAAKFSANIIRDKVCYSACFSPGKTCFSFTDEPIISEKRHVQHTCGLLNIHTGCIKRLIKFEIALNVAKRPKV